MGNEKGGGTPPRLDDDGFPVAMTPEEERAWVEKTDAETLAGLKAAAEGTDDGRPMVPSAGGNPS